MPFPEPSAQNLYLAEHVDLLCRSFEQLTGKSLIDARLEGVHAAQAVYDAPYIVVSHDASADPIFSYGNRAALALFEMSWQEFTALPSRLSAEPPNQEERSRLLAAVSTQGFIENYAGVRISRTGKRFVIEDVTVWNLSDRAGADCGQAAVYSQWRYL